MKRPWNRTNANVYSLATIDNHNRLNMNICTYVSVVNMKPRIYTIAIDYKTKTYNNLINNSNKVVLQALSINNIRLIRKLGKQSGKYINKEVYLKKKKCLTKWKNHTVCMPAMNSISRKKVLQNRMWESIWASKIITGINREGVDIFR